MIPEPESYRHWRDTIDPRWTGPQLSWTDVHPITLQPRHRPIFASEPEAASYRDDRDLWHYRRVLARSQFDHTFAGGDITLINWPQIDYWGLPLVGVDEATRLEALRQARELTLSFVYWMQTEAPRADGGHGYPELWLRGDVLGTLVGLAREPYIRESRRIKALLTVTEAHIGRAMRGPGSGSEVFADSVDIGCYPFQIPLGALIPETVANLLPANKNIGTTHITNGAYRLHPVEWSIGEAVGALAAYYLNMGRSPAQVHGDNADLRKLQDLLADTLGIPLAWPDNIRRGAGTRDDD